MKCVGSAREDESTLYETTRASMGAETERIARDSSSGDEAKSEDDGVLEGGLDGGVGGGLFGGEEKNRERGEKCKRLDRNG